jgi:DMSO/TMAO reductase YedYZ heme-binding membrane subunit
MNLSALIVPLGIAAYTFLLLTFITGIRKVKLKYHKRLAIIAVVLATIHAGIVLFLQLGR